MIKSGEDIQEMIQPANERRPYWRRISFFRVNSKLALQRELESLDIESNRLKLAAVVSATRQNLPLHSW